MIEAECDGSFDTPIETASKCDLCGRYLKDHYWYEKLFE